MHLAVLARQLGARELDAKIQAGGHAAAIALQAFEHAPDAYPERARLCSLLPRLSPPFRERALAGLSRVLSGGPERGEDTDPGAAATCRAALTSLSTSGLSEDERDMLSVALATL
jgi:hypothetical protein